VGLFVTAAIALTKTLTATATLGRISSAYPDGRVYRESWNSIRIAYPRPTSERNAGGTYDNGLNGEWDKWLAGVPWYPALGVMHGAFPYRVTISGETVDGSPADTGVQFAEFIEDHAATTPYLGFYHAGFTAPAGSSKVIAFTITVTDCLGETATYPVSLTVYAQDKADVLDHFRVVDTTVGVPGTSGNGTGHWSSPINTISGADVSSNKTLFGTDWSSTTHCPKTVIVLFKNGSTISVSGMTNVGGGLSGPNIAKLVFIKNSHFPRSYIGVYGGVVTVDGANPTGFNTGSEEPNDILIKNLRFESNATDSFMAINTAGRKRVNIHDVQVNDWLAGESGGNEAPIRNEGSSKNYDFTILRCSSDGNYTNEAGSSANLYFLLTWLSTENSLIDELEVTGISNLTGRPAAGVMRIKHDSTDCEWRRITCLFPSAQLINGAMLRLGTGGGVGADADKHRRFLLRYANVAAITSNSFTIDVSGTANEEHSGQCHFNTLRGGIPIEADATSTIPNAHEFLGYKNIVQNAAGDFALTNMTPITGEASTLSGNVTGTSGVVDDAGLPVDSQYLGLVGHTVITV
jgi:hypothetical protein